MLLKCMGGTRGPQSEFGAVSLCQRSPDNPDRAGISTTTDALLLVVPVQDSRKAQAIIIFIH